MLKIRLQRLGRKKRPFYRIVVAEHSAPIKGRYVESLGHYDPLMKEGGFVVDEEKLKLWISKGAQPTNTVARLSKGAGIADMDKFIVTMVDRRKKNAPEEEEVPASAETTSADAPADKAPEEKPVEEAKVDEPIEEKREEESASDEEKKEEKAEASEEKKGDEPEAEEEKPAEAA